MRFLFAAGLVLLIGSMPSRGQPDIPADVLTLARVKSRIAGQIQRLPTYTCLQETLRTARQPGGKKFERVDRLRLEVVISGDRELYAWPGDYNFSDTSITELVRGGAIGSGSFGLFTRQLFLSGQVKFTFSGEGALNGRRTLQYVFRVAPFLSGFHLRSGGSDGVAGYEGRFWADAQTHELLMLKLSATDIPPALPYASAHLSVEYRTVAELGNVSLPSTATLLLKDFAGHESRNDSTFTACREFRAESTLLIEDVSSKLVAPPASQDSPPSPGVPNLPARVSTEKPLRQPLPADLTVRTKLDTAVNCLQSAVGDAVSGVVTDDVTYRSSVLLPRGTVLRGRLFRCERQSSPQMFLISVRFTEYELAAQRYPFQAQLESLDRREPRIQDTGGFRVTAPSIDYVTASLTEWEQTNSSFYQSHPKLDRGLRMTWLTIPAAGN